MAPYILQKCAKMAGTWMRIEHNKAGLQYIEEFDAEDIFQVPRKATALWQKSSKTLMQIQARDSFCLSSTWLLEPKWGQIWVQKQWAGCFTVDRVEAGGSVLSPPQYRGGLTGLTGPRTHLLC